MNKMKECRLRYGITLKDISNKTFIPLSTLSAWEKGEKKPNDSEEVRRVANMIKCDVLDIIGD